MVILLAGGFSELTLVIGQRPSIMEIIGAAECTRNNHQKPQTIRRSTIVPPPDWSLIGMVIIRVHSAAPMISIKKASDQSLT